MDDTQKAVAQAIVNVFETGCVLGNYGAVTVLKGDSGHLTYGRGQTTLGGGNLYKLLLNYCQRSDANQEFADKLKGYLPKFQQKDFSLDTDSAVKRVLEQAGTQDPVMRSAQDHFFNENYFAPALREADATGITEPLGQTVVYDSHIHGGWSILKPRMPAINDLGGEKAWVDKYVKDRKAWLQKLKPPLPNTVYRMDSFKALINADKWKLDLPLMVHGVNITTAALFRDAPAPGSQPRTLRLTTPYLRGHDVEEVQRKLGLGDNSDEIYGPFTAAMVKKRQDDAKITEDGVGPLTRELLKL